MSETAEDTGPLSGGQVRALKIAIVVMGILIVLGLLSVIARIIYLAGKPRAQALAPAGAQQLASEPRLTLPPGAAIRNVSLSGDRLAVQYDAPSGSGIAILELDSGRVLSRVRIVPDAPRN